MDILAHALWAGVGVAVLRRRRPVTARTGLLTVALAVLPDIPHLLPMLVWQMWGDGTFAALQGYAVALPGQGPPVAPGVEFWSHHLHCIFHSAVVAGVVTLLAWRYLRRLLIPLAGWWSHILIDVFTHSADYYPSPVLYPFTRAGFDGIAWNTPWFMVLNYLALVSVYGWLWRSRCSPWARYAWLANFRSEPDRAEALERYALLAPQYEGTTSRIREVRARALDLLALQPGETVFDVACGAGAILPELSRRVGPRGRVVGIEQSPAMAALATQASEGCDNVRVLCEPVESFQAPARADAVIFCYTHDVLQSPRALENLLAQLRPGARVSIAGLCLLPTWGTPVNAWVLWRARHYLTTWRGLRAPWMPLLEWCPDLRIVHRYHLGTGYLAVGTVRSR